MKEDAPDPPASGDSSNSSSPPQPPSVDASSPTTGSASAASAGEPDTNGGAVCQNCGASLHGDYCHFCGQRHVPRLRARELAKHFADSLLNVADFRGTLWATLLEGARNPGRLARRYVEGERERFINPISYILLTTTLLFIVFVLFRAEIVQGQAEMYRAQWEAMGINPDEMFGADSLFRTEFGFKSVKEFAGWVVSLLQQAQTYFTLLYCLIAAALLRVVLSGHTLVELVVFNLYAFAQATLFYALVAPLFLFTFPMAYTLVGPLLQFGILALAGSAFFGNVWKGWVLPPLSYAVVVLVVIPSIASVVGIGIGVGAAAL